MDNAQLRRALLLLVALLLCSACGSAIPLTRGSTTSGRTTFSGSSSPLSTSCPSVGRARAAVMPALPSGHHTAVVYAANDGFSSTSGGTGFLKLYDTMTGTTRQILREANTGIISAQVSADSQWILFYSRSEMAGTTELQLVRVDGKYLQTLYCNEESFGDFLWSPDQKLVAFSVAPAVAGPTTEYDLPSYYLLNLSTGDIHIVLVPDTHYIFWEWLDPTHLSLLDAAGMSYTLDISKGPNQHKSDLVPGIALPAHTWSLNFSLDRKQLFFVQCAYGPEKSRAPCSLKAQPVSGGAAHTIYRDQTHTLEEVRAISPTRLLFILTDDSSDTSQNGLWQINIDGTGLTRLTSTGNSYFNLASQSSWSDVSRDGSMYSLYDIGEQDKLYLGSFGSKKIILIATLSQDFWSEEGIAGWTVI